MSRRGRALSLLLAVVLGAGVAVWLLLTAFPGHAFSAPGAPAPAPAPVEVIGPATVVASASCTEPDARDTIAVDGPHGPRLLPLDACGNVVGATVTVRMSLDETGPPVPARLLGTGGDGALVENGPTATSPLTGRLAVLLTGVAGLGTAGLLVAVVRERHRRSDTRRSDSRRSVSGASMRTLSGRKAARSTVRASSRPARGRSSAGCRTTSGARRAGDRPASRRPAPGRRRD